MTQKKEKRNRIFCLLESFYGKNIRHDYNKRKIYPKVLEHHMFATNRSRSLKFDFRQTIERWSWNNWITNVDIKSVLWTYET